MKTSIVIASIVLTSITSFATKRVFQTAQGRFQKVDVGDYMHLILLGDNNQRLSFVCGDLPENMVKGIDCNDLVKKPESFKDKILTVKYYEETKQIPEAQEKITWKYVDRIDLKN